MQLQSLSCDKCGAPIQVGPKANYVTCAHCGSRLAIHRTEGAVYTEVLSDIKKDTGTILRHTSTLLDQNRMMAEELSRSRIQREQERIQKALDALADEWDDTAASFQGSFHNGTKRIPTQSALNARTRLWIGVMIISLLFAFAGLFNVVFEPNASAVCIFIGSAVMVLTASWQLWDASRELDFVKTYDNAYADMNAQWDALQDELDSLESELAAIGEQPSAPSKKRLRVKRSPQEST